MSDLKKIRVQHVDRDENGLEVKTDVDVLTDASAVTMDGGDLKTGIESMINTRIENLIDGAPEELDTLKEIADELSKNQSGVTTILKKLEDKAEAKDLKNYLKTEEFEDMRLDLSNSIEEYIEDKNKELYKKTIDIVDIYPTPGYEDKSLLVTFLNRENVEIHAAFIEIARQDKIGLMSKEDKKKLDGIDPNKLVTSENLSDFKRCKVLTQSEYDALSSTEKNREDTLYFIKK